MKRIKQLIKLSANTKNALKDLIRYLVLLYMVNGFAVKSVLTQILKHNKLKNFMRKVLTFKNLITMRMMMKKMLK